MQKLVVTFVKKARGDKISQIASRNLLFIFSEKKILCISFEKIKNILSMKVLLYYYLSILLYSVPYMFVI